MKILRQLVGYGFASAVALAVDASLLYCLVKYFHWSVVLAASLSFSAGSLVAYLLALKLAFSAHRIADRRVEFFLFCALGLIVLAINAGVMALGTRLGFNLMTTKLGAAGATFLCNFILRRQVLFVTPEYSRDIKHVFVE